MHVHSAHLVRSDDADLWWIYATLTKKKMIMHEQNTTV